MNVKIVNKSRNPLPVKSTDNSSGYDVRANLPTLEQLGIDEIHGISGENIGLVQTLEDKVVISIGTMGRAIVPTGLFVEIPKGYHLEIVSRSGLASQGIIVTNSPGIIDSDYRGEIKLLLTNLSNRNFTIAHGDKLAQMLLVKDVDIEWNVTNELTDTKRNKGGLGSTGLN